MAGRQTRGRQRIPMRLIQSQDDLYATFSKRRVGLYKKASELSTLCGVDIGIIIFSPTDNPYSFFHPSMESVIERYRNPNQPQSDFARIVEAHTRTRIEQLNKRLDEVQDMKEQIKEREKYLDEVIKTQPKGWWEQPIESLNAQQVKEWKAWFGDLHARVTSRIEELRNGGSGSLENAPVLSDPPSASTAIIPSMFAQNYIPSADTSYTPSGGIAEADQLPGQYYYASPQGQDPFVAGLSQFYAPPQGHDPSAPSTYQYYNLQGAPDPSGAGSSQYSGSTPVQDPSSAGPSQYYGPPSGQNPSGTGPSQYHGPPPSQNPSGARPNQYFGPPLAQNPSGAGSGQYHAPPPTQDSSGAGPSQFYGLPQAQDLLGIGPSHFYVPPLSQSPSGIRLNRFYTPPRGQNQSGVGPRQFYRAPPRLDPSGAGPSQFYRPPLGLDPSGVVPRRFYNPQQGRDSSAAGGTGEASTSDQGP
ncbi:UNVERIFIED_CONTAM: Agamous-like MADS-box protein [Sesamum latifolium]|uniref:Agamous-like MADS-box protein n=1 Tax=Sesamum latifolium TaxID=2727402 RepID=A0AAW2SN47_9LAMI